ncbi:hypothetical protein J4Q44_G00027740 [Coregonus suidteri]|uniref:Uncharacterized protein n=1 Tax=Coregonus suidteri TaxID=861788 RepID=A0AAN8MBN8_9TELE
MSRKGAHQHQQASQQIPSLVELDEVDLEENEAQVNINSLPGLTGAVARLMVGLREDDVETQFGKFHCTLKGFPRATAPSS